MFFSFSDAAYKYVNKRKEHKLYAAKTICEEFITLIGSSIQDHIIGEVNNYKYYSISLDCTPNIRICRPADFDCVLLPGPIERCVKCMVLEHHSTVPFSLLR